MTTHHRRRSLTFLPVALGALLLLGAALAGGALAESGDMSGMHGMTDEEMQGMHMPGSTGSAHDAHGGAQAADGHAAEGAADPHGEMGDASGEASVNWLVIGGFLAIVAGSTLAAAATKRHLRRRTLAGEFAGAGVQDV